jgi:hypothetical protein
VISSYYTVPAAQHIRYLGFFFSADLTWDRHVKIMCNRARASLKSLQILGNSVRGLDFASWRLAYNAICLPVLTYGIALWAHKGLEKHFKQVELEPGSAAHLRLLPHSTARAPSPNLSDLPNQTACTNDSVEHCVTVLAVLQASS